MKRRLYLAFLSVAALCIAAWFGTTPCMAADSPQEWNLVNPAGVIQKAAIAPAPRISSLDGKTIALRWNGKHNGDVALNRLAELLHKKFPTAKIIKTYENDAQNISVIAGSNAKSQEITRAIQAVKPDLVIAAQCD